MNIEELIRSFLSHGGSPKSNDDDLGILPFSETIKWPFGDPFLLIILYCGEMHRVMQKCMTMFIVKMIFEFRDGDEFFAFGHAT